MSDLAKWKLHGPVDTLRTESATWDSDRQDWQPVPFFTVISFRGDGSISTMETHNPGGSIAHSRWLYDATGRLTESDSWMNDEVVQRLLYFYDKAGRHIRTASLREDGAQTDLETCTYDAVGKQTKTRLLPASVKPEGRGAVALGYSIEDTDMALGAPGAASITTFYASTHRPDRVILEDATHNSLREVLFTRDAAGRLLKVQTSLGGKSPFKEILDHGSPERREVMAAFLKQAFGDAFSRTTYKYDSQGRLIERTRSMGTMHEDRTTYHYDGVHDEPTEETTETSSRGASLEDGAIHYQPASLSTQQNRFDYSYDTQGNWTERIVSVQYERDADFQRSNIERRTITYFGG